MRYRHGIFLALLLAPGLAQAQDVPEQLLSANTQIYLRWDGHKAHRAAYDKTALGKMMKGDTGKFIDEGFALLQETLGGVLPVQGVLGGTPPEKLQELQADATQAAKLLSYLSDHGVIVAVEVRSALPPTGQLTLIVPNGGEQSRPLFGALRLIAALSQEEVQMKKEDGRELSFIQGDFASIGWWVEGKHAVVTVSTEKIDAVAKRMKSGNHARLPSNPLFKKITEFKDFTTSARGYLDVAAAVKLADNLPKEAKDVIEALGLDGLKAITFLSGFEGEYERSLTEIHTTERKGLLGLLTGKPFKLSDIPPLPTDAVSWTASSIDLGGYYDSLLTSVEKIVGVFDKNAVPQIQGFIKQVDNALGIDVRKDLLGNLGEMMVTYNSPAEGVFTLSQTYLFKVKNADKVLESLDTALKSLDTLTGAGITIKKKKYRGTDVREVYVQQPGFIFVPTYAVHKDWLAVSFYPQGVQGFILRSEGEVEAWKPEGHVKEAFAKLPKELSSLSVSDPRPSIKTLLSMAPLIGGAIKSFVPESKFEVGSIPNAHEACKHLFPNVSSASDDGKVIRLETRASLALPLDVVGLDTYIIATFGVGFLSAFGLR